MNTANPTHSTEPIVSKIITINGIELQTDKGRKSPFSRQYFVQISVGATSRRTRSGKETTNRTSWDETFYFDGDDRSVVLVVIYQKHRVGSDKLVGSFSDTIGGVLGPLKDSVIERTLSSHASGNSGLSGMTIKFALAAELRDGVNAGKLQATHAVTMATDTVATIGSMPGAVDCFTSVTEPSATVVNEAQTFGTTWDILLQRMTLFNTIMVKITESDFHSGSPVRVYGMVCCISHKQGQSTVLLLDQKDRDSAIIHLASTMSDVFESVKNADLLKTIEPHIKTIVPLIQQVTECGYFIAEYSKEQSFLTRTVKYTFSDINVKITNYENELRELKTKFLEGITFQTGITVVRMMNVMGQIQEAVVLNDMPYASRARYSQDKGCLPGTRETLLREICDILNNPADDAPRVCLLTGVAGSGKSAVAHTIAQLYDGQRRLGSSYCFATTDIARRNPGNLFSTIARDLADVDSQYKFALWSIVKGNQALRRSEIPAEQFEQLIVGPIEKFDVIGPIVIVIDALDESGEAVDRGRLLAAMSEQICKSKLPTNLRFLITSRPEKDIVDALSSFPHVSIKKMGDIATVTVDADIEKFIYHSFHRYDELESSWHNLEWCRLLIHCSQGLFQWAATTCNFIRGIGAVGLSPRQRFKRVLENDSHAIAAL
ncbi:hypothetical protein JVU11DRAFT_10408 [Chiua virens]|nr:hypothetical protein JVU11DRAFT_10408 [Chiua virens]